MTNLIRYKRQGFCISDRELEIAYKRRIELGDKYESYADDFFSRHPLSVPFDKVDSYYCDDLSPFGLYVVDEESSSDGNSDDENMSDNDALFKNVDYDEHVGKCDSDLIQVNNMSCYNMEMCDKMKVGVVRIDEFNSAYRDEFKCIRIADHEVACERHCYGDVLSDGDVKMNCEGGLLGGVHSVPFKYVHNVSCVTDVVSNSMMFSCFSNRKYKYMRDLKIRVIHRWSGLGENRMSVKLYEGKIVIAKFSVDSNLHSVPFSFRTDRVFVENPYSVIVTFTIPVFIQSIEMRGFLFSSDYETELKSTHALRVIKVKMKNLKRDRLTIMNAVDTCRPLMENVVALDCEFGENEFGQDVIVRVSVVNHLGDVLMDSLIFHSDLFDPRTRITGLTFFELLLGDSFDKVKNKCRSLCVGKIITGHSMDKELGMLGLNCESLNELSRYTAFPVKLSFMYYYYTGAYIQQCVHDSVEDARASLVIIARMNQSYYSRRPFMKPDQIDYSMIIREKMKN